jgi:hypothetical protein
MLTGVSLWMVAMALAQAPAPIEDAAKSAAAAEKAALAAQVAAEAAQRAAQAAEAIAARGGAPRADEKKPEEKSEIVWSGTLGAGLISLTGNARTITANVSAAFERTSKSWVISGKASGAYGQSRAVGAESSEVVAMGASLLLRGDRRFTDRYSGYVSAAADTDHIKSVELRPSMEAGVGILWIDDKEGELLRSRLRSDLAFHYSSEQRFQYYPTSMDLEDVSLIAAKLGVSFRHALNKDVIFGEDLEVLFNIAGTSRALVSSVTKIAARLLGPLSMGVGFTVNHDSQPAAGRLPTDTALNVGVEVAL